MFSTKYNSIFLGILSGVLITLQIFILHEIGVIQDSLKTDTKVIIHTIGDKETSFMDKPPKEGLMEALEYYGVRYPDIVYAQAVLETGDFKSKLCKEKNNLFGLYDSGKRQYYSFKHWSESVVAYKNYIQYKHKPPNDYYDFLESIGYAEDSEYTNKLRKIVNDKRGSK